MTHLRTRILRPRRAPTKGSLAVLVLAFTLTACSVVPDFANPIAIYNNTFGNNPSDTAERTSEAYPRLGTVPARPQTASAAERRRIAEGLVADRENARYVDEDVRGADAVRPARVAVPALVAAEERAVPAVPRGKVQVAAIEQPRGQEPARQAVRRPRDPAAPVPIEPRRRRDLAAARDTVDSQRRQDSVAAPVPIEPRRRQDLAAARDSVDSRRLITTGRVGGPLQQRALIPRQRVPVPRSIVQRENEDVAPRRVQRPASASVTQPRQVARLEQESLIRRPAPVTSPPLQPVETTTPRPRAPASVVVAQVSPQSQPPRRRRTPTQPPPVALAPGEDMLSKIYAEMLAASASTVTTAPANPAFKPTTALPLPQETLGVSPVVRESYNAALDAATAPREGPRGPPPTRVVESRSRDAVRSRVPARSQAPAQSQVAALVVPAPPAPLPARRAVLPRPFAVAPDPALVINFANGSARVTPRNQRLLREIAAQARDRGGIIRVVGHASSRTRDLPLAEHNLVNFGVSLDRAQSVANLLMRQGVLPERIIVEARADTDPIFFETMPEGEAENRRVEIFLDF